LACLGAATAHFKEIKNAFLNRNLDQNMAKNTLFFRKKACCKNRCPVESTPMASGG